MRDVKAEREQSTSGEWVLRSEVIRICNELGSQSADLALYGAPDNARSRESMEAAATRLSCSLAMLPGVSFAASDPAPWQYRDNCGSWHPCSQAEFVEWVRAGKLPVRAQTAGPEAVEWCDDADIMRGYWAQVDGARKP